jgi:hypothetical protein
VRNDQPVRGECRPGEPEHVEIDQARAPALAPNPPQPTFEPIGAEA